MAAAGLGNPLGFVPVFDGANPRIITGRARNEIISGGVFVFASGAADVVSSGTDSIANGDLLFTRDASGGQFNGICLQTTSVSGPIAVVTRGAVILVANGTVTGGYPVQCDGNNSVQNMTSGAQSLAIGPGMRIGRALSAASSGAYALIDIGA